MEDIPISSGGTVTTSVTARMQALQVMHLDMSAVYFSSFSHLCSLNPAFIDHRISEVRRGYRASSGTLSMGRPRLRLRGWRPCR